MQNRDAENAFFEQGSDKLQNWAWGKENKKSWHKVDSHESIRLFYNHWRGTPFTEKESYPYSLSLGDFAFYPELGSDILVTEAYDTMFHRLLDIRIAHTGCRGAVITGQPGIGKSFFLLYMLARLISANQVVLFCDPAQIYLLYDGNVYFRETSSSFYGLPQHLKERSWPILTMIDGDFKEGGPTMTHIKYLADPCVFSKSRSVE